MTAKKNISQKEAIRQYIPPRLVKAKQGWYVVFYHEVAGEWVRERKSFNLNRIQDKRRRLERAREIMQAIDASLTAVDGNPITAVEFEVLGKTPVCEAINFAADLLCQSPKKETRKSFEMIRKMLIEFIQKKKWEALPVAEFSTRHARAFLDTAMQRGISNTTFNNYRGFAVTLFNKLVNREYLQVNPFERIQMLKREEKRRRAFTPDERAVVLDEIYQNDYWLFVLVMLHRLTLLRRTECYRLRFSNFNLVDGYIHLPKSATKNGKLGVVTIPNAFRDFLRDERFANNPGNYLLFGAGGKPHASIAAGENTYKERHRAVLLRLKAAGKLADISGLSLYSWKDTGMTEFAQVLRPIELRDHARHASIDQSLEYYHGEKIIDRVKRMDVKVGK